MLKKILIFIMVTVLLVFSYVVYDNSRILNTEYSYTSEKVPDAFDGYRICLITDFHNADNYKKVAKAVKEANPDIICIGGDLVDMETVDYTNAVSFVRELNNIAQVYYTYGNHEIWSTVYNDTEIPEIKKQLEGLNIKYLNNHVRTIYKGDACINLIGYADSIYDDFDGNFEPKAEKTVESLYNTLDKNVLSVMVFHRAQYFDMLADVGYDIVLSGHLHGGHVNLPYARDYILQKHFGTSKYVKGMYKNKESTMYVCGGIEKKFSMYRIFNTPEIVTVELKSE